MMLGAAQLEALRLLLITDGRGDHARIVRIVAAAVAGGVRAVQLREPGLGARDLAELANELRPRLHAVHGMLLVNDRVDVVAAGCADGVQLGHRSLLPAAARTALGPAPCIGLSVHGGDEPAGMAGSGADFLLLAPVWATTSKPGAGPLGVERAAAWTRAAKVPVLWLGGVTAAHAVGLGRLAAGERPHGVAVRSALCEAADVRAAAAALRASWLPLLRAVESR